MGSWEPCGRVTRLGLTPVKGGAHVHPDALEVGPQGPVGDRGWCLLERRPEPGGGGWAVARTARTPRALAVRSRWRAGELSLELPGATFTVPDPVAGGTAKVRPGDVVEADYWGRLAGCLPVPGPWDAALSALVGRAVTLARVPRPGDVVYAEPVVLLTTSTLTELSRRAGTTVDDERFRSAVLVGTGDAPPFVEDTWHGRALRLGGDDGDGTLELVVTAGVPRCAVVRMTPGSGERTADDPLRLLSPDRLVDGPTGREVVLGVGAQVRTPGTVRLGDAVALQGC